MVKIPYSPGCRSQFLRMFFTSPRCNPASGQSSNFVVVKIGFGLYGTGSTKAEAIRSAQGLITGLDAAEVKDYIPDDKKPVGAFYVAPCTESLACAVIVRGGAAAIPYNVNEAGELDLLKKGVL